MTSEVRAYAAELAAPHVELLTIAGAGHAALVLRDEIPALLRKHVLPKLGIL